MSLAEIASELSGNPRYAAYPGQELIPPFWIPYYPNVARNVPQVIVYRHSEPCIMARYRALDGSLVVRRVKGVECQVAERHRLDQGASFAHHYILLPLGDRARARQLIIESMGPVSDLEEDDKGSIVSAAYDLAIDAEGRITRHGVFFPHP